MKHEISGESEKRCSRLIPCVKLLIPKYIVQKSSCLYRASMTIKTLYYQTDAQIYNS